MTMQKGPVTFAHTVDYVTRRNSELKEPESEGGKELSELIVDSRHMKEKNQNLTNIPYGADCLDVKIDILNLLRK